MGRNAGCPHWEGMEGTHGEHPPQAGILGAHSEHQSTAGHALGGGAGRGRRRQPRQRWAGGLSLRPLSLRHADPAPAPVTAPSALPQIPRPSPCPSSPRRCRRARGSCSPAWRPPTPRSKATGEGPPGGPSPASWLGFSITWGRGGATRGHEGPAHPLKAPASGLCPPPGGPRGG